MAAISIQNISWPIALIAIGCLAFIAIIIFIHYKYRNKKTKNDEVYTWFLLAIISIMVIFLLDFVDVIGNPGETWISNGYNWIILLIPLLIAFIMAGYFIYKTKPLPLSKRFQKAIEYLKEYPELQILSNDGGTELPVYAIKNTAANQKLDNLSNKITYFIITANNRNKCIVGINNYTGELEDLDVEPEPEVYEKLKRVRVIPDFNYGLNEIQGISGLQQNIDEEKERI